MTKPPQECQSLEEVRAGMDALDREIIALIAKRVRYVRAAAKFKKTEEAVADTDRMEKVYAGRRAWAEQAGLNGAAVETIYREIVNYCVAEEKKYWNSISKLS